MARPIPILLCVRELGIGGIERDLAKIARRIDRKRFEPHVCVFYPGGIRLPELEAAGIPVFHLPVRSFLSRALPSHARLLGRYLADRQIQLIHCFDVATEILVIPLGRWYGVPVLIKSQLWYRDMVPRRYRSLLSITDRLADAIVVNSDAIRHELTDRYRIPAGRVYLSYNGVEPEVFSPDPNRPALGPERPLTIGAACALRPEKRLDLLLEAFARVRSCRPGLRLSIVGSGAMRERLEEQRQRLGIVEDSHFEPMTNDVTGWMRQMDIFVLCSASESFPNALLEAMACGCCVVGSRVGGVPELIRDGQNGLLFEPGNIDDLVAKLSLVLDREDLRHTCGAEAVRTAHEDFPMDAAIRRTEEIYDSLLADRAAALRKRAFER